MRRGVRLARRGSRSRTPPAPRRSPTGSARSRRSAGLCCTSSRASVELVNWRPTATDDLGFRSSSAWAYVADILTFYNERYANEYYLRTAMLPEPVRGLVGLLGYRPRPAIGATGRLAVIADGPGPLVVPQGVGIASKASPGIPSQTFEVDDAARFERPTSVPAPTASLTAAPPLAGPPASSPPGTVEVPPQARLVARGGVLLKGAQTLRTGERLLLSTKTWSSADSPAVVVKVLGTAVEADAHGRKNTRVLLDGTAGLPSNAGAADYRLLRSSAPGTSRRSRGRRRRDVGRLVSTRRRGTSPRAIRCWSNCPARASARAPAPASTWCGSPTTPRCSGTRRAAGLADRAARGRHPRHPAPGRAAVGAAAQRREPHGRYGSATAKVTVQSGWREVGTLLDTPVAVLSSNAASVTLASPPPLLRESPPRCSWKTRRASAPT